MKKKFLTLSIILFFLSVYIKAQQGIVATGGDVFGIGGSVSYTVGQIDYNTLTGSGGVWTEGLQQPYEIFLLSGIETINNNLNVSVFPNPFDDYLSIECDCADMQEMSFSLYDSQYKLISNGKLGGKKTTIAMTGVANGTYFIKIQNRNNEIKLFKNMKNK